MGENINIDNSIETQENKQAKYNVEFHIVGSPFYSHFCVNHGEGEYRKKFRGTAGSYAISHAAGGNGDIYTDDIEKLFEEATSFTFKANVFNFSIYFYDNENNLLGDLQTSGIGFIAEGGGKGRWN